MRTLTIGVLVVAGGTLAALPFRRYQAIPDASSAPAQVTGPMQSVLESTSPATIAAELESKPPSTQAPVGDYLPTDFAARRANQRRDLAQFATRRADIPLTYEDLEVPIDQPDPIKQRFNATAPIRAEQLERERVTALVMPKMETLAITEVQQIQQAASRFAEGSKATGNVTGSLASSRAEQIDDLPASPDSHRQRHWIRQPD